jgi:transcriptional regulator with XRE-family HTH domain
MSLTDLARESGLYWSEISAIERGVRRNPGLEKVVELSRGLGMTPSELVALMDGPAPARRAA